MSVAVTTTRVTPTLHALTDRWSPAVPTDVAPAREALVTGHDLSRVEGPQPLGDLFQHDGPATPDSLALLGAAPGSVVVPGHGPVRRGWVAEAVVLARDRASRTL